MSPIAKSPAAKAGIQAGDLILRITDKANNIDRDTTGISLDEAVKLIRGDVGTGVTLKMYREGQSDTFEVTLTGIMWKFQEWNWNGKNTMVKKLLG
jgi:carboxyl-terminal processing protease